MFKEYQMKSISMIILLFPFVSVRYGNDVILDFLPIFYFNSANLWIFVHCKVHHSDSHAIHVLTLIPSLKRNYICCKMWREITLPFITSNGAAGGIWKWQNVISSHTLLVMCLPHAGFKVNTCQSKGSPIYHIYHKLEIIVNLISIILAVRWSGLLVILVH